MNRGGILGLVVLAIFAVALLSCGRNSVEEAMYRKDDVVPSKVGAGR